MQPYLTFVPNLHVNLRNINHELIQRHRVIRSLKDEKLESTSKTLSLVSVSQDSGKLGTQTELEDCYWYMPNIFGKKGFGFTKEKEL